MINYPFNLFAYGIYNKVPPQTIPDGAAFDSLNWRTIPGRIELNRGYQILGTESSGAGRITGLRVGKKANGYEVAFRTHARKIEYYDSQAASPDWTEVNTVNYLPAAADGEDITLDFFESRAGKQMWLNSPSSGPSKIMLANPGDVVSMYDATLNYKGWMRIFSNQVFLWNIDGTDQTAVRLSYVETRGLADYDQTANTVVGLGDGTTKTFAGTFDVTAAAAGTLTSDATAPSDGDTVTIDTTVYTFKTTLTTTAFQVKINGSAANALINLQKAVNLNGTAGSDYSIGTTLHPTVSVSAITATTATLTAKTAGTDGNSIVTTETSSHLSFGAGTLQSGTGSVRKTVLDVSFTDSNETFSDNQDGTLTGSLGGTGTINYATRAYSITFATAPVTSIPIKVTYRYVDETKLWGSHGGGIANFSVPGSRVSGEPNVFRQDHGGALATIVGLKDHRFCIHENSIYDILASLDDTETTNTIFREGIGMTALDGGYAAAEGIYTIDTKDLAGPRFVVISYAAASPDIKARSISDRVDLTPYEFDQMVVYPFADYVLYGCRTKDSPINNRTFAYNRIYKTIDLLDYYISKADIFNGTLIAGDPLTNNVQTLFSGYSSSDQIQTNYWKSGISKLGQVSSRGKRIPIKALKKVHKIFMEGDIGPDQVLHMFVSLDRGPFVEVLDEENSPIVSGNGTYVDKSNSVSIGAQTLGTKVIGGGGDGVEAYHYERVIKFRQDKFAEIQIMIQTSAVGYASVINMEFRDIRILQNKPARKYRVK